MFKFIQKQKEGKKFQEILVCFVKKKKGGMACVESPKFVWIRKKSNNAKLIKKQKKKKNVLFDEYRVVINILITIIIIYLNFLI